MGAVRRSATKAVRAVIICKRGLVSRVRILAAVAASQARRAIDSKRGRCGGMASGRRTCRAHGADAVRE